MGGKEWLHCLFSQQPIDAGNLPEFVHRFGALDNGLSLAVLYSERGLEHKEVLADVSVRIW
jgi:hypothetical protein